jgi:hypothetical protein
LDEIFFVRCDKLHAEGMPKRILPFGACQRLKGIHEIGNETEGIDMIKKEDRNRGWKLFVRPFFSNI